MFPRTAIVCDDDVVATLDAHVHVAASATLCNALAHQAVQKTGEGRDADAAACNSAVLMYKP